MQNPTETSYSPWSNRAAWLLGGVAFVLIWFGGLVTTTKAGMAVPDWPNTFGYNMFLYPVYDWFFGPWDLFVEHGHRLLGTLAGMLAILLVWVTYCSAHYRFLRTYSVVLLLLVIFQGVLGGTRVLLDARTIAKLHGCIGPLFFMGVVAFCVLTSKWFFRRQEMLRESVLDRRFSTSPKLATLMLSLCYLQLVAGSFIRHIAVDASPKSFLHLVYTHIGLAFLIFLGTLFYWFQTRRELFAGTGLRWSINLLVILVTTQISLGLGTWVLKYGIPGWFDHWQWTNRFVIPEQSLSQTNLVTAHMALGSLILAIWTVHVVRIWGLVTWSATTKPHGVDGHAMDRDNLPGAELAKNS